MARMIGDHPFHGYRFEGRRFDCGDKAGMVIATLTMALARSDIRDEIMEELDLLTKTQEEKVA